MKPRETRHPVLIQARMRDQSGWSDVLIQNVSSHGMMLSTSVPPHPGSFIEIRKAAVVIVARAVWVDDGCFGVRTQDVVDIGVLLNQAATALAAPFSPDGSERRKTPRPDDGAEKARWLGNRLQFALIGVAAGLAALTIGHAVGDMLSQPFSAIEQALGGSPAR